MTPTQLREWIKQRGLSHQEAADLLARSRESLRHNLYGANKIGKQTARIVELLDRIDGFRATSAQLRAQLREAKRQKS